jgi:hypothetical protein
MNLINWNSLISNATWIIALAWLLYVISMARWTAINNNRGFSKELDRPLRQAQLNLGGMIFCVGLALVSEQIWQMIMLIALSMLFFIQLFLALRSLKN